MKITLLLLLALMLASPALPQIHVQVEPADTAKPKAPSEALDSGGLIDAMRMDGVVRTIELQLRPMGRYITPTMSDTLRREFAIVLADEVISLWEFQIERAQANHDTLLLASLRLGLSELAKDKTILAKRVSDAKKRLCPK
jgi:hypothetical protein